MKSLAQPLIALLLLTFAGAPFAQDDVAEEEEGGWFSSITGFFSDLFGGDDEEDAADPVASGGGSGIEWYAGAEGGVTKYEERGLRVARGSYGAYGGAILRNRLGFEVEYLDLGSADVKSTPGEAVEADGYRGMLTFNTEAGDAPVRLGVGYYAVDASVGSGASDSSSGLALGARFEQGVTEHLFLSLGTELLLGGLDAGGDKSDILMFTIGVSFHTAPPPLEEGAGEEEDAGVEVTEPAAEEPPPVDVPIEDSGAEPEPAEEEPVE